MKITQKFNGPVVNQINTDNYYEGSKNIKNDFNSFFDKYNIDLLKNQNAILEMAEEIKNEPSEKLKNSKFENWIKEWGGTISEIAVPVLKSLIFP